MLRLTGPSTLSCGLELSVTCTVMFDIPAVVGVPLTVQPTGINVSPAGSVPPVIEHVYGFVPPVTPMDSLYGTPTVPFGRLVSVKLNGPGGLIVRLSGPLVLSCGLELSTTLTVRFEIPAAVGVPLIVQPFPVKVRPAGSVPPVMLQVYGAVPPFTRIVAK